MGMRPSPRSLRRPALAILVSMALATSGCGSEGPEVSSDSPSAPARSDRVLVKTTGGPGGGAFLWAAWASDEQELEELWTKFRVEAPVPAFPADDSPVVLVATGESGTCPWRVTNVSMEADALAVALTEVPPSFDDYTCTDDFNPVAWALVGDEAWEPPLMVDIGSTSVMVKESGEIFSASYDHDAASTEGRGSSNG